MAGVRFPVHPKQLHLSKSTSAASQLQDDTSVPVAEEHFVPLAKEDFSTVDKLPNYIMAQILQ